MKAWPPDWSFPALIAHQGGWDEIAMVVGPLVVVGFALWVANKRATNQLNDSNSGARSDVDD